MSDQGNPGDVLTARLGELNSRLSDIRAELRQEHAASFAEQAVEREGEEVLEALEERILAEIAGIQAALGRIEAGTYGDCLSCGEPIDPRRLASVPETPYCAVCADSKA